MTCVCFCHLPDLDFTAGAPETPSWCTDEGESGSGADISRRTAACNGVVPGGPLASAASCDGDGGCDSRTGELGSDAQRGVGGSETREVRIDDVSLMKAQDPTEDGSGVK